MTGLPHRCLSCGVLTRGKPRCPACTPSQAQKYGGAHQRARRDLLEALRRADDPSRAVCPLCDQPLGTDPAAIHLDHVAPIAAGGIDGPRQLTHKKCNLRAGDKRGTFR